MSDKKFIELLKEKFEEKEVPEKDSIEDWARDVICDAHEWSKLHDLVKKERENDDK